MAISTINCVLLFTIIMVSMNGINSQLVTTVVGVRDIINILENITDTSTTTSMFLPHLASLLKKQEDVQRLTNLILQNQTDTCAVEDVASILQEIFEDQQINNDLTTDLMHNYTNTLTGMANVLIQMEATQYRMANDLNESTDTETHINETLILMASTQSQVAKKLNQSTGIQTHINETLNHMASTQSQIANDLNQSAGVQTHMNETLNLMASTQSQVANDLNQSTGVQTRMEQTLNRMASTQSQIANYMNQSAGAQTRMEETLNLMAKTQSQTRMPETLIQVSNNTLNQSMDTQHRIEDTVLEQIANTQTQTANALTQVVNLLQVQSEQLLNVTATMMYMVGQINIQNQLTSRQPNDIRDCSDLASRGPFPSGSYTIQSWDNLGSFRVYCDMDTDDGGWTVFQKRFDGTVNFYQEWNAYEEGFGSPDGEHWIGLRELYRLTRQGSWTLRIDLEDFENNTAFAEYRSFSVDDAVSHYQLTIVTYSGTAGDSLTYNNNQAFTTKDSDHDPMSFNCAQHRKGAWWYSGCGATNLNGLYLGTSQVSHPGMNWFPWKRSYEVLKRSEMKIRRIN